MKKSLVIVKVGGKIVEQPETLERLLTDFKAIPGDKLLVHGGGRSVWALRARWWTVAVSPMPRCWMW